MNGIIFESDVNPYWTLNGESHIDQGRCKIIDEREGTKLYPGFGMRPATEAIIEYLKNHEKPPLLSQICRATLSNWAYNKFCSYNDIEE